MIDYAIALVVVSFAVATAMELFKSILNAILKKDIPSYVWWISGGVLSIIGTFLAWKAMVCSSEEITPLLSILLSPWLVWAWSFLVWWIQMQLDMKVIKKYALPILKKLFEKKLGVDEDE